jgi:hypothetical protein
MWKISTQPLGDKGLTQFNKYLLPPQCINERLKFATRSVYLLKLTFEVVGNKRINGCFVRSLNYFSPDFGLIYRRIKWRLYLLNCVKPLSPSIISGP